MDIESIDSFLAYFESVRGRTLRVAKAIPPERIEWRYRDDAWSFGDLLRHLGAIERYMFAENARGRPSAYPGHGPELAEGYDGVLEYLDRMHREAVEVLRGLSIEDLEKPAQTPAAPSSRPGSGCAPWSSTRSTTAGRSTPCSGCSASRRRPSTA